MKEEIQISISRIESVFSRVRNLVLKLLIRRTTRAYKDNNITLACNPTDYIGRCIIADGIYSASELQILSRLISNNERKDVMLDIGANIGNHGIFFSKLFNKVICFEPYPPNSALLRANILLSNKRNIIVEEIGLGKQACNMPYIRPQAGNAGAGRFTSEDSSNSVLLKLERGDDLLQTNHPEVFTGQQCVDFIKCDVEGFEPYAFEGLEKTLRRHKPIILFECNDQMIGDKCFVTLKGYGYKYFYELKRNDSSHSLILREFTRVLCGQKMWLELVTSAPIQSCDIIATCEEVI